MKSIGVDLHKCSLTVVVLDEQGQIVERKDIPTKCHNQIREYFASSSKKRDRGCFLGFFPLRDYLFWLQIRNFS